jgi:hypothetical protein
MEWINKALLTAAIVALLLGASTRFGRRGAGLLAGLPTITGPALWWLAVEHGHDYAGQAAVGSVAACGLCALFALAYERASRRLGAFTALAVACLAAALSLPLLQALSGDLSSALAIAGLVAGGACVLMSDRGIEPAASARPAASSRRHDIALTALVAGAVSGVVAWAAPATGPFWAGVLASPPLLAAAVAVHEHASAGHDTAQRFLRGYVAGLIGRAAFAAGFALLVAPFGVATATLVATAVGCVFAAHRLPGLVMSGWRAGKASS